MIRRPLSSASAMPPSSRVVASSNVSPDLRPRPSSATTAATSTSTAPPSGARPKTRSQTTLVGPDSWPVTFKARQSPVKAPGKGHKTEHDLSLVTRAEVARRKANQLEGHSSSPEVEDDAPKGLEAAAPIPVSRFSKNLGLTTASSKGTGAVPKAADFSGPRVSIGPTLCTVRAQGSRAEVRAVQDLGGSRALAKKLSSSARREIAAALKSDLEAQSSLIPGRYSVELTFDLEIDLWLQIPPN